MTPIFWVIFLAFPVFLARLAGEEHSAGAGKDENKGNFYWWLEASKKNHLCGDLEPEVCLIPAAQWVHSGKGSGVLGGELEVPQPRNSPGLTPASSLCSARVLEQPGRREIEPDPARCAGREHTNAWAVGVKQNKDKSGSAPRQRRCFTVLPLCLCGGSP